MGGVPGSIPNMTHDRILGDDGAPKEGLKCVFILDLLQSWCNFITLLRKYMQQKKVGLEIIFSEIGFAGSRMRKPWWEFKGSALKSFFYFVLRLNGALIV